MARPSRFSPEVRERAVEHAQEHASQWAAWGALNKEDKQ
jgi:hypothetical protein